MTWKYASFIMATFNLTHWHTTFYNTWHTYKY